MAQNIINMGNGAVQKGNVIDQIREKVSIKLRIQNQLGREILAEIMGTAFLIMMGETGGAIQTLSRNQKGDVITSNFAWGFGVFFALLMTQNVSGGHFNPVVTVTFAFLGKIPWKKVIPYCIAQVFGAFIGAALVFITYYDAINAFDGGVRQIDGPNGTASIFATYPSEFLSTGGSIFDQIIGTCSLLLAVLAANDPNNGMPKYLVPFAIAFYVTVNGWTFAYNAGGAINPARDLGPRIMTAVVGYGSGVFTYQNYWFWIPIVFPMIGGLLAAAIYNGIIGIHYPESKTTSKSSISPMQSQLAKAMMEDAFMKQIYLTQQSLESMESLGKRESGVPLVR
jgi:MIP family channel proteins